MRSRLWLALLLVIFVLIPCNAYASEYVDMVRESEDEPSYTLAIGQDRAPVTPISAIRGWFSNVKIKLESYEAQPLTQMRKVITRLFTYSTFRGFFVVAIGLVFIWWGVRKVIRVLFRAFRRGKIYA